MKGDELDELERLWQKAEGEYFRKDPDAVAYIEFMELLDEHFADLLAAARREALLREALCRLARAVPDDCAQDVARLGRALERAHAVIDETRGPQYESEKP